MELSVNIFVSLDGVMQGPGGAGEDASGGFDRGGWLVPHADEDMGRIVEEWFAQADAILLGRTTYQAMYPYWSTVTDSQNAVAVALNTLPKYVVSASLTGVEATWHNTTLIDGDVIAAVRRLKEHPGRELQVHGSWRLAQTLHEAELVDVYRLLVFPTVVGTGKRLFDAASTPAAFVVEERASTRAGATALTLRRTAFQTGGLAVQEGKEVAV